MKPKYRAVPFSLLRRAAAAAAAVAAKRSTIHSLTEVDITEPRRILREQKLSLTAYVVACLARAVAENPLLNSLRKGRRLILLEDVTVAVLIERELQGERVPEPVGIQRAQAKSFRQIHEEIRSVQTRPRSSAQSGGMVDLAQKVPGFVRRGYYWALRQNPHRFKQIAGTTIVTSVGMFGKGSGWGFGFLPMHNLGLTVGGIAKKPGVIDERIEIREYLDLTVSFDHDIVDGAPAARFAQRLKLLIEGGEMLAC